MQDAAPEANEKDDLGEAKDKDTPKSDEPEAATPEID